MKPVVFKDHQVLVNGVSTHVIEAGSGRPIVFLHGYPQSGAAFEPVMNLLANSFHVLAPDLPGIGKSGKIPGADKKSVAAFIDAFLQQMGLTDVVMAGHDIGGMVTYSCLRHFPARVSKAVIMDTAVPGIAPWEEVKRNPFIWHFAFFAVPSLPEALITGKQKELFNYFYDTLAASPAAIPEGRRNRYVSAYQEPDALRTSLEWYRAFLQDEKDNAEKRLINTPVMYVRGEKEPGRIEEYINGFKESGLQNITGKVIPGSGHFSPEEQAEALANAIAEFLA
ncbi:alpha/beta hydrolase [Chitinophaga sp.]|uniref:alpha/beta fold hydrolase n=1 Tax=Chitinophaga sp. TaxID=1869181 RepID=UPI0031E1854B